MTESVYASRHVRHPGPLGPGSVVTIYAGGFGQTTPASVDGLINDTSPRQMTVSSILGIQIAGQNAQILYAGPAPGQVAGVSQINFRVPPLVSIFTTLPTSSTIPVNMLSLRVRIFDVAFNSEIFAESM